MVLHFKTYYQLTKPGIIYGNVLNATGGFLLAARGRIDFGLFLATLLGLALIIASACVFNNYIDRNIDKHMKRTKKRALVSGLVSPKIALIYGVVLGVTGTLIMAGLTNGLAALMALTGYFFYVVVYGIAKRRTVHGTVVGSISGAIPPVVGYTAVTGQFDKGALIVFLILVFWQMPHFYAIALYRLKDYGAAGIPVLPLKKGARTTKIQILVYIIGFMLAVSLLSIFGFTGYTYLFVMLTLSMMWLWRGFQGFKTTDDALWGRKMFSFSLIVILALAIMMSIGPLLP